MASLTTAWEIAQALGLCAVAGCLIVCVLAVRPRAGAAGAFPVRGHELLGWLALAAAVLHVGLLLGVDHRVVEHVRLPRHRNFQAAHVGAACLLVVTLAVHVVATGRYVHGRSHVVAYTLLSGIVLLALLRARAQRLPAQQPSRLLGGLVFGRHSRLSAGNRPRLARRAACTAARCHGSGPARTVRAP